MKARKMKAQMLRRVPPNGLSWYCKPLNNIKHVCSIDVHVILFLFVIKSRHAIMTICKC